MVAFFLVCVRKTKFEQDYPHTKICVSNMDYIKKICPVCGTEFFVLKDAEKKAVYCTLACLAMAQDRVERRGRTFPSFG